MGAMPASASRRWPLLPLPLLGLGMLWALLLPTPAAAQSSWGYTYNVTAGMISTALGKIGETIGACVLRADSMRSDSIVCRLANLNPTVPLDTPPPPTHPPTHPPTQTGIYDYCPFAMDFSEVVKRAVHAKIRCQDR